MVKSFHSLNKADKRYLSGIRKFFKTDSSQKFESLCEEIDFYQGTAKDQAHDLEMEGDEKMAKSYTSKANHLQKMRQKVCQE